MYTILMSAINVSGRTATNLYEPGTLETLTPEDIETRIYGSKIVILLEQSMLILIWGIKGCMILMYNRLTYASFFHSKMKNERRKKLIQPHGAVFLAPACNNNC